LECGISFYERDLQLRVVGRDSRRSIKRTKKENERKKRVKEENKKMDE
jgi:hypothetical protein